MLSHLRTPVTALCLTACILLIALWVRSHRWADVIARGSISSRTSTSIASNYGAIVVFSGVDPNLWHVPDEVMNRWGYWSEKARPVERHFGWTVKNRRYRLEFPTWLPVLFAAGLAVVPWIKWRFSLRTLLIATTLVAAGLGIIAASR